MKNKIKLLGIIVMVSVIMFGITGCDGTGSGSGGVSITIMNNTAQAITNVRIEDANGDRDLFNNAIAIPANDQRTINFGWPSGYGFGFGYMRIFVTFSAAGERWIDSPLITRGQTHTLPINAIP